MRRSGAEGQEEKRQTKKMAHKNHLQRKKNKSKRDHAAKSGIDADFTLVSKHKSSRQKVHMSLYTLFFFFQRSLFSYSSSSFILPNSHKTA